MHPSHTIVRGLTIDFRRSRPGASRRECGRSATAARAPGSRSGVQGSVSPAVANSMEPSDGGNRVVAVRPMVRCANVSGGKLCSVAIRSRRSEELEPVERALQDQRRRHLVDRPAARRRRDRSASSSVRSAAAVDRRSSQQQDGHRRELAQIAGEGARGLGARALRAVQIDGQADHEARRRRAGSPAPAGAAASAENLLRDSVVSPEAMVRVTSERARPSGLGAEVEPHQASAGGQGAGEGVRLEDAALALSPPAVVPLMRAIMILVVVAWPAVYSARSRRPGKGSASGRDNGCTYVAAPRAGQARLRGVR